jgi:hypothetical protein
VAQRKGDNAVTEKSIRQIRIEGNIAFIPLTKGYEAVIDAADVHLVEGWNWHADVKRNTVYAGRSGPRPEQRKIHLHRAIMGDPDGLEIDHIDGDGLNNRRANLRAATHGQNQRNRGAQSNNSSGFKGVSWDKPTGKWRAQIEVNGKNKHLGRYNTPEAAHAAYCKASDVLHGEFGRAG